MRGSKIVHTIVGYLVSSLLRSIHRSAGFSPTSGDNSESKPDAAEKNRCTQDIHALVDSQ